MPPSQKEDSDRMVAIKYGTRSRQNIGTSHLISPPFAIKKLGSVSYAWLIVCPFSSKCLFCG
jgi:hypothetical protein